MPRDTINIHVKLQITGNIELPIWRFFSERRSETKRKSERRREEKKEEDRVIVRKHTLAARPSVASVAEQRALLVFTSLLHVCIYYM